MLQYLCIKSWIEQAALKHFLFINNSRGGLCFKPRRLLAIIVNSTTPSLFNLIRQINDEDLVPAEPHISSYKKTPF